MGQDLFGEIVRRADLQAICPIGFFANRGDAPAGGASGELELKQTCSFSMDDSGSELTVLYEFEASPAEAEGDDVTVFRAGVKYRVVYSFEPALTSEHTAELQRFAEHNGRFTCWPFVREFLARSTADMGLAVLMLPLLKPFAPPQQPVESLPK